MEESRERALKFEQQVKDEQLRFHELEVQSSLLQQKVDELHEQIERGGIVPHSHASEITESDTVSNVSKEGGGTQVEVKKGAESQPSNTKISSSTVSVSTAKGT